MCSEDDMQHNFIFNRRLVLENRDAFENIALFDDLVCQCFLENIVLDFSSVSWIEGELCCLLRAIMNKGMLQGNSFFYIPPRNNKVDEIFKKNGFISFEKEDTNNTVVKCKQFSNSDIVSFIDYISLELFDTNKFPYPTVIKENCKECLAELFDNAASHSGTSSIFTCGQYFPNKHELAFCITDIGVGIVNKVRTYDDKISKKDAIKWAFQNNNTTKSDVGGLGLKLFLNFVQKNNGSIVVFSDNIVYKVLEDSTFMTERPFKGTSIIFKLNIDK